MKEETSMDAWDAIYGGSQDHPLVEALADIVRRHGPATTKRAKRPEALISTSTVEDQRVEDMLADNLHHNLLYDARKVIELLETEHAAAFGPTLQLEGVPTVSMSVEHILDLNLDDFDEEEYARESLHLPVKFFWEEEGLSKAALAYSRECGWDFAPGEAGRWIVYCLLTSGSGGGEDASTGEILLMRYQAQVVGFAILHDRDRDEAYESLAHIWVAKAARGRGVASRLVREARARHPLKKIEEPITDEGQRLFAKAWPEYMAARGVKESLR